MRPLRPAQIIGLAEIMEAIRSGEGSLTREMVAAVLLQVAPLVQPLIPILQYGCSLAKIMEHEKIRLCERDLERFANGPDGRSWLEQHAWWCDHVPNVTHRFKRTCQAARTFTFLGMTASGDWLAVQMSQSAIMHERLRRLEEAGNPPVVKLHAWAVGPLADVLSSSDIELSHWMVGQVRHWLASTDRELTNQLEQLRLVLLQLSITSTLLGAAKDGPYWNSIQMPYGPV